MRLESLEEAVTDIQRTLYGNSKERNGGGLYGLVMKSSRRLDEVERRAADLAQAGRDIDVAYDDWLVYNRADLEAAGLLDGSFVNVTRMQRLITGAIWQLSERIRHMEKNYGRGTA